MKRISPNRPNIKKTGFTLLELLVILALFGILASIVVPNIIQFIGRGDKTASAEELHNVIVAVSAGLSFSTVLPHEISREFSNEQLFPDSSAALNDPSRYVQNKTVWKYDISIYGQVTQRDKASP